MQRKRLLFYALLVICVLLSTCTPQSAKTRLEGLRFYTREDKVITILSSRDDLTSAEHLFLAEAYNNKKEYKKAMYHYTNAAFVKKRTDQDIKLYAYPVYKHLKSMGFRSSYYDVSALKIGELFYTYKEYDFVLKFCKLVSEDDPVLYFESIGLAMNALRKQNKFLEAAALCDENIDVFSNKSYQKILLLRKAGALHKAKKYAVALQTYIEIIEDNPSAWHAHSAAEQISTMLDEKLIHLNDHNALLTATSLLESEKTDKAETVLQLADQNSTEYQVLYVKLLLAKGEGKKADTIIKSHAKKQEIHDELLLAKADQLWKKKKTRSRAVVLYKDLVTRRSDLQSRFARVCRYLYMRNRSNAVNYMIQYIDLFPDTASTQEFMWMRARSYLIKDMYAQALPILKKLVEHSDNRFYGNASYWLYRYYKLQGNETRASAQFKDSIVNSPDSWYTWILADQLKDSYNRETLQQLFDKGLSEKSDDARFANFMLYIKDHDNNSKDRRIDLLKKGGIYPYEEFESYVKQPIDSVYTDLFKAYFEAGYFAGIDSLMKYLDDTPDNSKYRFYIMSNFGDMYDHYFYSYYGSTKLVKEFNIKEDISLLPTFYVKRLYPLAFKSIVEKVADKYQSIDKYQMYAVMKAESAFKHNAVSHAGATGLMQIMPATGKGLAKGLKLKSYDLKQPEVSILFGFSYMNWLHKYYDGRFDQMLGGYNAGPGNMNKWKKKFNTEDVILFAEMVPIYETRHYMFKNQKFLIQYKTVYAENN